MYARMNQNYCISAKLRPGALFLHLAHVMEKLLPENLASTRQEFCVILQVDPRRLGKTVL